MQNSRRQTQLVSQAKRRGALLPIAGVSMILIMTCVALVVDWGLITNVKNQTQTAADAAALAAALQLYPSAQPQTAIKLPLSLPIYKPVKQTQNFTSSQNAAHTVAGLNRLGNVASPEVLPEDIRYSIYEKGVLLGPPDTLALVDGLLEALDLRTADHSFINAIDVTVRRNDAANGQLNLFFAPILGVQKVNIKASATAAIMRGYGIQSGDMLLPFAMDVTIWNAIRFTNGEVNAVTLKPLGIDLDSLLIGDLLPGSSLLAALNNAVPVNLTGSPIHVLDEYTWTEGMTSLSPGPDKIWEVLLLGDQLVPLASIQIPGLGGLGGLLGGLLGSVTRGPSMLVSLDVRAATYSSPSSTNLNRVIASGINDGDVTVLSGGSGNRVWLPFTAKGHFEIPNACEAELKKIIGKPRIMPLYATLPGTISKVTDLLGMPHNFQIVGWAAVVVTEVKLSGTLRYIKVQPAIYHRWSVQPALGTNSWRSLNHLSDGVYTSPRLVR